MSLKGRSNSVHNLECMEGKTNTFPLHLIRISTANRIKLVANFLSIIGSSSISNLIESVLSIKCKPFYCHPFILNNFEWIEHTRFGLGLSCKSLILFALFVHLLVVFKSPMRQTSPIFSA